ncbi:DUF5702 domain-containing protein [Thomasclavelia saccharogumia]|uniref:DUF5702 domain-containing protein n=1 Tax=Thomasclavelia saccharogumia TaxID=341225 RepID=UPI00047B9394|nr:DUF5702 domain-containing protein [Thomasclavelia saccharogumia]
MNFLIKKCRGGVTVFLIIIMLPSFMFGGYVFDAARLDAAKTIVTSSGDLVLNALLSEFHDELYDDYGLLATKTDPSSFTSQAEMYFNNNLESSSMIQGSDSVSLNIINGFKNFMNNSDSQEFDNLIKISAINDLKITGANESQITNPDVMKNQIIEYMKYRGPVSLASGLLTKLKTLGDIDKQAEAINKKVEYEDKLNEIGKSCEEAYKKINEYNTEVTDPPIDTMVDILKNINGTQMDYICRILYIQNKSDNKVTKYAKDKLNSSDKSNLTSYSQDHLYSYIEKYLGNSNESSELNAIKSSLSNALALKNENSDAYPETMYNAVKALEKKYSSYNKLYYYCTQYCKNYEEELEQNSQDEDFEEDEEDREKYEKVNDFKQNFADENTVIYQIQNNKVTDYSSKIDEKFSTISANVNKVDGRLTMIDYKLGEVKKKLETVEKKLKKAEEAKNNYKNAIDNLAQSEYKVAMEAEYKSSARNLDEKNLKTLQNTITKYREYVESFKQRILDGGTFYGKNLSKAIKSSSLSIEPDTKESDIKKNFVKYKLTNLSGSKAVVIDEKDKFYKYLKSICKDTGGEESQKSKLDNVLKNAKPPKEDNPLNNGNSSISSANGYGSSTTSSEKVSNFEAGNFDKNKTASKFMNYFNSMGSYLKSITNLKNIFNGENSRDTLYMSEYITEMFSYYTINKDEKNLAGKEVSANPFYRSEVEYILCGMDTPQENIDAIKSKLFTTRFVLNLLYAFTDTDINTFARNTAAAISGSMPFMIPVVRTIIVCGFALGESTIDVKELMAGNDVAFLKTNDTFMFKPDKFGQEVIDYAKEEVIKATEGGIDDITSTVLGISSNGIDSIGSSLNTYIDKVSSDIVQNIESTISSALFAKAEQIICDYQESTEAEIEAQLNNILSEIKNSNLGSNISDRVKDNIFSLIPIKTISEKILTTKKEYLDEKIDLSKALEDVNNQIKLMIENMSGNITDLVKENISGVSEELKNQIQEIADNYSDDFKSAATEEINKAFDKFNQSISSNTTDTSKKGNSSAGAGFTMNYKEYLKLFVLLQNFDNSDKNSQRDAMLQRTANLIGINLNKNDKSSNDLAKMYTIISIGGNVEVETTFLNIPIIENEKGQKDFDFKNISEKSKKLNYESVRGY